MTLARITYSDGRLVTLSGPLEFEAWLRLLNDVFDGRVIRIERDGEFPEHPRLPATAYIVGPGILDEMRRRGDAPAGDESYIESKLGPRWALAPGVNSRLYVYDFNSGKVTAI